MGLENIAATLESQVLARAVPLAPRAVVLPEEDDVPEAVAEHLGDAEGQSFMIEYIDAAGRASSRRITVYDISLGNAGIPLLTAKCHERRATRQFRVDRIRCCIDYSGEVHDDVARFLADNFGMSVSVASRKAADVDEGRWRDILARVKDDAVLLAAMAECDGSVHVAEVEVATRHLAKLAERDGRTLLSDLEVQALGSHLKRLRPTGKAIERALDRLASGDAEHVKRLLLAAIEVLDADGRRHLNELEFLDNLCLDLTGIGLRQP